MNAEEPNDDYDAQAAEAARKANIEELNAVMPQALEERVRVLEEALRDILNQTSGSSLGGSSRRRAAALLSPAAATEGGEGA